MKVLTHQNFILCRYLSSASTESIENDRDDDREATVRTRLEVYHAQTRPLVDYYSRWADGSTAGAPRYRKISGLGTVEEIRGRAFSALV